MPKAEDELTKHTLNLFAGDYAKIQACYPDVGAAVIIRRIVRSFIEKIEPGAAAEPNVEIKL
jgi:hypothetical protein